MRGFGGALNGGMNQKGKGLGVGSRDHGFLGLHYRESEVCSIWEETKDCTRLILKAP